MNYGLTEDQIANRKLWVGASDAGKIVRGELYQLWLEKTGASEPKAVMSPWARALRHVTEELQMDWLDEFGGRDPNGVLVVPPGLVDRRGMQIISEQYPFMGCTIDGWIGAPVNAKHLSPWSGKKDGLSVRQWALREYVPQITHEAIVTGALSGWISLMSGENEPELLRVDVDPWFAEELVAKEREFWGYVQRNEPPPDAPAMTVPVTDTATLRTLDISEGSDKAAWPNWRGEAIELIRDFAGTEAAFRRHAITRDKIKQLLPADVGEMRYGLWLAKRNKAGAIAMTLEKGKDDGAVE